MAAILTACGWAATGRPHYNPSTYSSSRLKAAPESGNSAIAFRSHTNPWWSATGRYTPAQKSGKRQSHFLVYRERLLVWIVKSVSGRRPPSVLAHVRNASRIDLSDSHGARRAKSRRTSGKRSPTATPAAKLGVRGEEGLAGHSPSPNPL